MKTWGRAAVRIVIVLALLLPPAAAWPQEPPKPAAPAPGPIPVRPNLSLDIFEMMNRAPAGTTRDDLLSPPPVDKPSDNPRVRILVDDPQCLPGERLPGESGPRGMPPERVRPGRR